MSKVRIASSGPLKKKLIELCLMDYSNNYLDAVCTLASKYRIQGETVYAMNTFAKA
jgi:hypothetical protein